MSSKVSIYNYCTTSHYHSNYLTTVASGVRCMESGARVGGDGTPSDGFINIFRETIWLR